MRFPLVVTEILQDSNLHNSNLHNLPNLHNFISKRALKRHRRRLQIKYNEFILSELPLCIHNETQFRSYPQPLNPTPSPQAYHKITVCKKEKEEK